MIVLRAAFFYAGLVFAAGFLLGVLRTLVLAPHFGETMAVALELPVMLAISWFAAGFVLRGRSFGLGARAAMGALAFALLMGFEAALGLGAMGLTPSAFVAKFSTPPGALGLAGQIAFGVFPVLRHQAKPPEASAQRPPP